MTSRNQNRHWQQPSYLPYNCYQEQVSFVTLRRSRKGTHLNVPEEFYNRPVEQAFIRDIPVLPNKRCCDMENILFQQKVFCDNPSVTINIGTSHAGCRSKVSYSTISINPSIVSEEPWQTKRNVIPLGLRCCENRTICEHTQSREQRVVNLDVSKNELNDKRYVYITTTPKISPLKSCWKLFTCRRKKTKGETYLPTVMTKNEPRADCAACPAPSENGGKRLKLLNYENNLNRTAPSKLSTITESDISVSEYSSEEFNLSDSTEKKEKLKVPRKGYKGNDGPSFYTYGTNVDSIPTHPEGQVYQWVCEPSTNNNRSPFDRSGNLQYVCYKKSIIQNVR